MSLNVRGILVRPTRFELVTSCSGGKQLSRVIYNLGREMDDKWTETRAFLKRARGQFGVGAGAPYTTDALFWF